jgi:hypothetical protein
MIRRRGSSDVEREPDRHVVRRLSTADAPALERRLVDGDEDVRGRDARRALEVPDDRRVESALRVGGPAGEDRELDERERG